MGVDLLANGEFTRNLIAQGTRQLMRNTTINDITVIQICNKAGISRRNFYRYFPDKYAVVDYLYNNDCLFKYDDHENWSVWDYLPQVCQVLYQDKDFYANAFRSSGQNSFREHITEELTPIISADYAELFGNDQETRKFFIDHICNFFYDYFLLWLSKEDCLPPEDFYARLRNTVSSHAKRQLELLSPPAPSK